ncbi:MAG: glycerate kinase [Candidatus Poribacteria bacterium]|nr:glycerate kinase [Candidatus Poribacteria bacterium]
MKIVIAPDSFKGSLTALQAAEAMEEGIRRVFPAAQIMKTPMADGGEGTVRSLVDATGGKLLVEQVANPLGNQIEAEYGILGDGTTAVIEMAAASGLTLVPRDQRNPLVTTTYGTGQLIKAALDRGCRKLIVGIGGSATNDGGAGLAEALGAKLLTNDGKPIPPGGGGLRSLDVIDIDGLDPRLAGTVTVVACDVDNPLTGMNGAAHVYGPQKGATPKVVEALDANLAHFAWIVQRDMGKVVGEIPGAGAAGGLGAGLIAFLNAELKSGVEIVIDAVQLEEQLEDANLVVTGEGEINFQTVFGKTPVGVAKLAKKYDIPVIAITGSIADGADAVYEAGIDAVIDIVPAPMPLDRAIENAFDLAVDAAASAARFISVGMRIPP